MCCWTMGNAANRLLRQGFPVKYIVQGTSDSRHFPVVGKLFSLLDVKELLNVQVRRLSLGERMKMEILAALIHRPDILFLDEPTIGQIPPELVLLSHDNGNPALELVFPLPGDPPSAWISFHRKKSGNS